MLEALRELGIYSLKEKGLSLDETFHIFVESPFGKNIKNQKKKDGETYPFKVIKINFKTKEGVRFDNIEVEDYEEKDYKRYLYRRKAAQGPDFTPVSKYTEAEKTIPKKLLAWFKLNRQNVDFIPTENIYREFQERLPEIIQKVKEAKEEHPRDVQFLVAITLDNEYPGDREEFKDFFVESIKERYKEVSHEYGVCSLCGKKGEVFGNAAPYTFYTLDKPGYIAGGFRKEEGWRNFPICLDCALLLTEGKSYLEEVLGSFRFAGINYYLIPRSILGDINSLGDALIPYETYKNRDISIKDNGIAQREDDILLYMKDLKDFYTLTFLFYTKQSDKIIIDLLLEDIYPSRIRRLFDAKYKVEKYHIFKNAIKTKNELRDVYFNFSIVKQFVESEKSRNKSYKEFLNIIDKIFKGNKIDYDYIMGQIMKKIRKRFVNNQYMVDMVLGALIFLYFLDELGLIDKREKGGENMSELIHSDLEEKIKKFFEEHQRSFISPERKAVFLIGVLTQFLLNIQRNDRGAEPFRSQLKSLKMGEDDIKALFPKVIAKLEDYKKNYYKQLEGIVSSYLLQAGDKWKMTKDEINYYFVLGLTLANAIDESGSPIFKPDKIETEEGGETNE